jgi:hypothetical protein
MQFQVNSLVKTCTTLYLTFSHQAMQYTLTSPGKQLQIEIAYITLRKTT